ncbi:MAG: hypothetical protein HY400_07295 [Elusimicrobia bacterium]|nr:hypothetical protein [Elusimicrobiota bacterium]
MFLLLFFAFLSLPSPSFAQSVTPSMEQHVLNGIDLIFSMEFDKSEAEFNQCLLENSQHPYGHFAKALSRWARYVYDTEQTQATLIPEFNLQIQNALAVSQKWIKTHPQDARGILSLGGIYGLASRLDVVRKEWISAYLHGRKAIRYTRLALKKDPTLYDAYLGIGMYDYYSDALPRFISVLSRLVLRGNRLRGIQELKIAAEKGTYTQLAAQLILIEIYTEDQWGAKNPQEALQIVRSIRAKYPHSSMFQLTEIVCLYEAEEFEEVRILAEDFLRKIKEGRPTYRVQDEPKAYVSLGTALWALNFKTEAKQALENAALKQLETQPNRWSTWATIRLGHLEDTDGNRTNAKEHYKKAATLKDPWGFHKIAKKFLSRPFSGDGHPGPLPPP